MRLKPQENECKKKMTIEVQFKKFEHYSLYY